jgi:3-oxoacyl-[acyl-carrier protein] reductase
MDDESSTMDVSGGSALVTSTSASGGLGQEIARVLAGHGVHVVLSARRIDVLEGLATEFGASVIGCDLTDAGSTCELVAQPPCRSPGCQCGP